MTDKYYVAGCVDNGLSAEVVDDEHAEFWTLYERDSEGLSEAIIDCVSRKEAEAAMAVYVERDRLNEQVRALAAESLPFKKFFEGAWHVAMDGCDFDGAGIQGLAVNLGLAKAEVYDSEKHSDLVSDASDFEDGCEVFFPVKLQATDSILNEVRAQAVEGFVTYCGKENSVFVETKAYYRSIEDAVGEYADRIRAGEVPNA